MKIVKKDLQVNSSSRCQLIDITDEVSAVVRQSGITDGDAIVYCIHTTAAITINENADPSVVHDMLLTLEELLPKNRPGYRCIYGT